MFTAPYIYVTLASTRSLELALSGLTFLPIPRVLQGDFDRPGPGEDRKHKGLFLKDFYPAHANNKFFQFQEAREELRIVEDGGKGCIAGGKLGGGATVVNRWLLVTHDTL